jgi:hypothetical protein
VVELLGAKLALLGLVGAVSTFQWGVWDTIIRRTWAEINDTGWTWAEARLEAAQAAVAAGRELEEDVEVLRVAIDPWRRWRNERVAEIRNVFIPYSRAMLTNYRSAAYFLLLSSIVDLVALLVKGYSALEGAMSAGMLMATFPPFADTMLRYALGFGEEFGNWERGYTEAERPPPSEGRT